MVVVPGAATGSRGGEGRGGDQQERRMIRKVEKWKEESLEYEVGMRGKGERQY